MRYRVLVTFVVWMVEATIDPYNSKESTGHPESDDKAYDEKAKKENLKTPKRGIEPRASA